jgi:hypothetical protein
MKKRILGGLLAFLLLGSTIVCAVAAEPVPHASLYLDGYGISVSAEGKGKMAVTYVVLGTDTMDKLGAQSIKVEEWDGTEWVKTGTYSVSKNPSFYASDVSEHAGTIYFYGLPGIDYRATLTAYAELDGGSDTGTVTSDPETCK